MIKAIIFDCDGTLVDSEEAHYLSWRHALAKHGYELKAESYTSHFVGRGEAVLKIANDLVGYDCCEEVLKDKREFFHKSQQEGLPPIAATLGFLHLLVKEKEKHGLKLAVASGARKEEILHHLRGLGIEDLFDAVLSGQDDVLEYRDPEGTNKPKPYVYLKAAKMLGVAPEECIAIEDSRSGVSAAVKAGCITIAVPNRYTRGEDLSHAHFKLDSFAGLTVDDLFEKIEGLLAKEPN